MNTTTFSPKPVTGRRKGLIVAAAVTVLAAAAWLGAGAYIGVRTEAELQALLKAPPRAGAQLRVTQLTHQRGWWQSQGQAEITLVPGCSEADEALPATSFKVVYQIAHLPLPTSLARFDWQANPIGETGETFRKVFGTTTSLSGTGAVTTGGAMRSDLALPALTVRAAGETLQASPSTGFMSLKDKQLAFGWKTERLVLRTASAATEVKDFAIDVDLKNRYLGTGESSLSIGQISGGFGTLDGLAFKSTAAEKDGRLDMRVSPTLRRLQAGGQTLDDLALEIALQGVDTPSMETLSTLFSDSCGMTSLTATESRQAHDALTTLLTRGFSVGITRLAGKTAEGSVSGQMTLELRPADNKVISLAAQLRSSGELKLVGPLLTPEQRELALTTGFAQPDGTNLRASYSYGDGLLKVNSRTLDGDGIRNGLAALDAQLRSALADWSAGPRTAQAPAAAPAEPEPPAEPHEIIEEAPAQAPTPEPAPETASASTCTALPDCVRDSLQAARRQDIEAVRALASRIEALPKPDQGNRAVARKINSAALELLKQGSATEAVQRFTEARQENPRDVEIGSNLGYALVKAGRAPEAASTLQTALLLDPRRTSTWTPLAEALALSGRIDDAHAALWIAYQWSGNRDKSAAFYADRTANETQAPLQQLYARMNATLMAGRN